MIMKMLSFSKVLFIMKISYGMPFVSFNNDFYQSC